MMSEPPTRQRAGWFRAAFPAISASLAVAILFAACAHEPYSETGLLRPVPLPLIADPLPPAAPETKRGDSFLQIFGPDHDPTRWYRSNMIYDDRVHPAWLARQIHFLEDRLELELTRRRVGHKTRAGAEYQRRGFYHFGRYEVVMRAAPGSGTISAMFTHTHSQFGDPHDEIDIEFLGRDLNMVTFNYFTDGEPHGLIYVPLSFDASREVHLYAFEWEADEIRWFVNDQLVHTSTAHDHPIPQSPSRVILQLWTGGPDQYGWHGKPTFRNGTRAAFYCLSFRKAGDSAPQCSDSFDPQALNPG